MCRRRGKALRLCLSGKDSDLLFVERDILLKLRSLMWWSTAYLSPSIWRPPLQTRGGPIGARLSSLMSRYRPASLGYCYELLACSSKQTPSFLEQQKVTSAEHSHANSIPRLITWHSCHAGPASDNSLRGCGDAKLAKQMSLQGAALSIL